MTIFLIGMATEKGMLPSLEEHSFEPQLVQSILDLRSKSHRIESNHQEDGSHRLSRVVTQATEIF